MSTYDHSDIPLEGMVHLPVTYQSETIQNFPFYVTRSGSSLMGLDRSTCSINLDFKFRRMASSFNLLILFQHFPQCSQVLGKLPSLVTVPELNRKLHLCHKKPYMISTLKVYLLDNLVTRLTCVNDPGITMDYNLVQHP